MSQEDEAQTIELHQYILNNTPREAKLKYEPGEPGYGDEFCEECGAEVVVPRRELGFSLCIICAEIEEARLRRLARR